MKQVEVSAKYHGYVGRVFLVTDKLGAYLRRDFAAEPRTRDWRDRIRIGDIIREGKTERIVRECSYSSNGILRAIDLVILRCSWTTRCYTVISRADLKVRGFYPTGRRAKLKDSGMDKRIAKAIRSMPITLTCCDVEGLR